MPAKKLHLLVISSLLAVSALACGKKDEEPPAEQPDKADKADEGAEAPAAATSDEDEEAPKDDGASAEDSSESPTVTKGDKGDKGDKGGPGELDAKDPRKNFRDRLANRRPPPRLDMKGAPAGEGEVAEGAADEANDAEPDEPAAAEGEEPAPAAEPGAGEKAERDPTARAPDDESPDGEPGVAGAGTRPDPPDAPDARPLPPPPTPADRDPRARVAALATGLEADKLMPLATVVEITDAKGLMDAGVLPGIANGESYSSIHYRGAAPDKFGVSLQVWRDPARREADDRFRRMRLQYPNAEDIRALPAKAFFAHFSGIQMLTFVDSVKRVVATVACAESICSHDQLTKLAKAVREQL